MKVLDLNQVESGSVLYLAGGAAGMLAAAWQWAAESPLSGEGIALPGFMAGMGRFDGSGGS